MTAKEKWPGVVVGFFVTVLALSRVPPGVTAGDAGELAAAAFVLGTGHPPGQALYLLLAKGLGTMIPFGSFPFRLGLLSALASGAAAGILATVISRRFGKWAALAGGIGLAFFPPFGTASSLPELYPIFWLGTALLLTGILSDSALQGGAASLSAVAHPEGFLFWAATAPGRKIRVFTISLFFLSPVLIYPWLRLQTSNPVTWWLQPGLKTGLVWLTAAPYRQVNIWAPWYSTHLAHLLDLAQSAVPLIPWAILAVKGFSVLDSRVRWRLLLVLAADLFYTAFVNPIPPSVTPALIPAAMVLVVAAAAAVSRISGRRRAPAIAILSLPILLSIPGWKASLPANDNLALDYAKAIIAPVGPSSKILLGNDDNDLFSIMALQNIGDYRPDCFLKNPVGGLFPNPPNRNRDLPGPIYSRYKGDPPAPGVKPVQHGLLFRWVDNPASPRWFTQPAVRWGPLPAPDPLRNLMAASYLDRLAFYYESLGKPALALPLRLKMTAGIPRSAESWGALGTVYLATEEFQKAVDPLRRAVELKPQEGWWTFLLGTALLKTDRMEEGRKSLYWAAPRLSAENSEEADLILQNFDLGAWTVLLKRRPDK